MFNANLENRETMKPTAHSIDSNMIQTIFNKADCIHDLPTIEKALDHMADGITQKLKNANPLVICVMVGALIRVDIC